MKHINGQSSKEESFLLNSRGNNLAFTGDTSFHPCSFGKDREQTYGTANEDGKPLLSYLFFSGETSKVEEQPARNGSWVTGQQTRKDGLEEGTRGRASCLHLMDKMRRNRKMSGNQRFRTDVEDFSEDFGLQMENLRKENEMLRAKLLKSEKTIISLQSVHSELEYIKKLSFLQQTEIQKLRSIVKQTRLQKAELSGQQYQLGNEGLPDRLDVVLTEQPQLREGNRKYVDQSIEVSLKKINKRGKEPGFGKQNRSDSGCKSQLRRGGRIPDGQLRSNVPKKYSGQSKSSSKSKPKRLFA